MKLRVQKCTDSSGFYTFLNFDSKTLVIMHYSYHTLDTRRVNIGVEPLDKKCPLNQRGPSNLWSFFSQVVLRHSPFKKEGGRESVLKSDIFSPGSSQFICLLLSTIFLKIIICHFQSRVDEFFATLKPPGVTVFSTKFT